MEQNIITLDYLEGINLRFGMYLGVEPIQQCVKEIISNSLDEAKFGYGDKIEIAIDTPTNTLTVRDFGRGIPADKVIDVLTKPHTGGKFDTTGTAGLNGIGVKAVTAMGEVTLTTFDGKYKHTITTNKKIADKAEMRNKIYMDSYRRFSLY